jgi:hypothetical protein
MRHLKTFENSKNEPQVVDYVILDFGDLTDYITYNSIFKLVDIKYNKDHLKYDYVIDTGIEEIEISKIYIKYWSKDKKDLEHYITSNKYNL